MTGLADYLNLLKYGAVASIVCVVLLVVVAGLQVAILARLNAKPARPGEVPAWNQTTTTRRGA